MLIGKTWAFIHIPKCGGMALRSKLTGIEIGEWMPLGSSCAIRSVLHRMPRKRPQKRIKVFTVVRHPADWLRSYWRDQSPERIKVPRYLHKFWSDDLNKFVTNVCTKRPGYVTTLYNEHMPYRDIQVFRLEDGLDQVIKWLGIKHTSVPIVNQSPPGPELSAEARSLVAETEPILKRYRYEP